MNKDNDNITKSVMEQYEEVRSLGPCNMFDYHCVIEAANYIGLEDLAMIDLDDYKDILMNFGHYMQKYNLTK